MRFTWKKALAVGLLGLLCSLAAQAQEPAKHRGGKSGSGKTRGPHAHCGSASRSLRAGHRRARRVDEAEFARFERLH